MLCICLESITCSGPWDSASTHTSTTVAAMIVRAQCALSRAVMGRGGGSSRPRKRPRTRGVWSISLKSFQTHVWRPGRVSSEDVASRRDLRSGTNVCPSGVWVGRHFQSAPLVTISQSPSLLPPSLLPPSLLPPSLPPSLPPLPHTSTDTDVKSENGKTTFARSFVVCGCHFASMDLIVKDGKLFTHATTEVRSRLNLQAQLLQQAPSESFVPWPIASTDSMAIAMGASSSPSTSAFSRQTNSGR